ncbi:cytochrome b/b6 domain-containing protein [Agromyces sp. GXS1127]|uniref:cytochrome b/b6 domain-containing protein n=1 Tax=Agromyces sp. GXS1127 TaxID=3424181 RepID=UPI003D315BB0
MTTTRPPVRRGLPRRPGGDAWPPPGLAPDAPVATATPTAVAAPTEAVMDAAPAAVTPAAPAAVTPAAPAAVTPAEPAAPAAPVSTRPLRRGLPRRAGAEPWPAAGFAPAASVPEPAPEASVPVAPAVPEASIPATSTAPATTPPSEPSAPARPWARWALAAVGLVLLAAAVVLVARWLRTLDGVQAFLAAYPGEAPMPEGAPVGFPAWLAWQHFFNVFLMVLIVRSGWQVRRERRPAAYWSPRWNPARKIGLNLWFHQSLDLLWLVNGVAFVVLLFATGQWMRIVPTSLEVIPNAISAALQYASLDWPTENGWVHYNGLQQLTYFATVFVAAPLAVITGVRMSGLWPARAKTLSRIYPVEVARAIHFPVMLYFVAFIVVHVALVLATGALRNLNHMYGGQDAVNWVGFIVFAVSLIVIGAAWVAARPLVLAPIAGLFGRVSNR